MSTLEEASAAKDKLAQQLMMSFNKASYPPIHWVCVSEDAAGPFIEVCMNRQPTPAEKSQLPDVSDEVRVKYKSIDKYTPF